MPNKNMHSVRTLVAALGLAHGKRSPSTAHAANDAAYVPVDGDDFYQVCRDGDRTHRLTRAAGSLIAAGLSPAKATELLLAMNRDKNEPPLDDDKVRSTVTSIARTHARNHPGDPDPSTPLFELSAASVGRFLDREAPQRQWVLENCIPLGKAALLVAPGGTGKSMLMLQMAYDVAVGRQSFSPWAPVGAGKVVILSAEDEEEELHRRFLRLAEDDLKSGDGMEVAQLLRENLYIVPRVGEDNLMTRDAGGEVVQTAFVDRLLKSIEGVSDIRLIVLDPLSRFRGGEENSAEDTTRCVEAMEALAKRSGAAVLAAHHTNKVSANGSEPNQHASRGSSALVDGVRLVINLSIESSGRQQGSARQGQLLDLRITKSNYGPTGEPILLYRDQSGRLVRISADEAEARRQRELLSTLTRLITQGEVEGRRFSKSTFAASYGGPDGPFGMGQKALKDFLQGAIDAGVVEVDPGKSKHLTVRRTPS